MKLKYLLLGLCLVVVFALPGSAAPFTQCPAGINAIGGGNDPWPSCAYLLTINPNNSVTVTADTALLQSIFMDKLDPEDILLGVQNNSGRTQYKIRIRGSADGAEFFAFDPGGKPDFPYTGKGNVFFTNIGPASDDLSETPPCFKCIAPRGTVNFTGGLANGKSTWFGLEGASQNEGQPIVIRARAITPVPEPGSMGLLGLSLVGLAVVGRRQKIAANFRREKIVG